MAQSGIGYGKTAVLALLAVGVLIATSTRLAQSQCSVSMAETGPIMAGRAEPMPAYDVATIKPWDGKGFAAPLRFYIQHAFGISPNINGGIIGPDWISNTRYVIQGKPPESIREALQTMTVIERTRVFALMDQSLLANRFHLKAHIETREMPVYELVLAKGGAKLKENSDPTKRRISLGTSMVRGNAMPISGLIQTLECATDIGGRAVIDKTGLTSAYDISLKWTPLQTTTTAGDTTATAATPDAENASLFTALEEQLGLKLVPSKGPVQIIVIDHIEQPTEN